MSETSLPSKEQVRLWMAQRQAAHLPLPDIKQIRRELGWGWNLPKTVVRTR